MPKRTIDTNFWNTDEVIESFTVDDKYFWLYLMTNPHINLAGVMPLARAAMARDLGFNTQVVDNLIYRFENIHRIIQVDRETKEILVTVWDKYNWTKSPQLAAAVQQQADKIKSQAIKNAVIEKLKSFSGYGIDTVSIGYGYGTVTDNINIKDNIEGDDTSVEYDTYTRYNKEEHTQSIDIINTEHPTQSCACDNNITNSCNNIIESTADAPKLSPQAQEIYDLWREIGPIKPRVPSEAVVKACKAALGKFSIKDITEAITHYVAAYNDPKYFFKYKWDLPTFLKQRNCIPNFMEGGVAWENYKAQVEKRESKQTPQKVFVELEQDNKQESKYE